MARGTLEIVPIGDLASAEGQHQIRELTGLWLAQRVDQGVSPEVAARAAGEGRLAEALARKDVRGWLARLDGSPVGYLICSENPFGLSPYPEVAIEQLFVDVRARRHGVARALLAAVVTAAERIGSEVVVSNVPSQSREAQRFFARLGFGSVLVRRVAATSALRRRLTPDAASAETMQVLRRRRSLVAALRPASRHTA